MIDQRTRKDLATQTIELLEQGHGQRVAIIGNEDDAEFIATELEHAGVGTLLGHFGDGGPTSHPLARLADEEPDLVVVAEDGAKEAALREAAVHLRGCPRVVISGYAHFEYRNGAYHDLASGLEERSLANGYPNSRIHLYECLANAAALDLEGIVVEFGMFRGGTTLFLSRAIEQLGMNWPVVGLDTFDGFPPRESLFDMYDHPDLNEVTLDLARRTVAGRDVTVVPGDIRRTASTVAGRPVVLAFVDTDNYTPARATLEAIVDNVVIGGCIVFDHYTGVDSFKYTLGERMAAADVLVDDPRFFNLHGTGVFVRQWTAADAELSR